MHFKGLLEVVTDDTLDAPDYSLRHRKAVSIFKNKQFANILLKEQKSNQNVCFTFPVFSLKSGLLSQSKIPKSTLLPFNPFEISHMLMREDTEIRF